MSEFVHKPFKSRVSVSHSPLALLDVSLTGYQRQTSRGLVFLVQVPQTGDFDVGLRPLTSEQGGGLHGYDIPPTCGLLHQGYWF